jgi:hypothetical protein
MVKSNLEQLLKIKPSLYCQPELKLLLNKSLMQKIKDYPLLWLDKMLKSESKVLSKMIPKEVRSFVIILTIVNKPINLKPPSMFFKFLKVKN